MDCIQKSIFSDFLEMIIYIPVYFKIKIVLKTLQILSPMTRGLELNYIYAHIFIKLLKKIIYIYNLNPFKLPS